VGIDAPFPDANCYVTIQGNCIEVHKRQTWSPSAKAEERGEVTDFSRQSRMRMMRALAKINWPACGPSVFVSLTYPPDRQVQKNPDRKAQREKWLKRMEYSLGRKVSAIWRVEWKQQLSGKRVGEYAPHHHLALLGVKFIPWEDVRQWWREIIDVEGPLCTDIREIDQGDGMGRYLAKYVSKYVSLDNSTYRENPWMHGRHWGITRKPGIPMYHQIVNRKCTPREIELLNELGASIFQGYGKTFNGSFTLFGDKHRKAIFDILGE